MPAVAPHLEAFVKELYRASDVPPGADRAGDEAYADLFLPDATLLMVANEWKGRAGLLKFRETGWDKVATRKHTCLGIYPAPADPEHEAMVYGVLDYGFKDGAEKKDIEWAGRFVLAKNDAGEYKIKFYQVWVTMK